MEWDPTLYNFKHVAFYSKTILIHEANLTFIIASLVLLLLVILALYSAHCIQTNVQLYCEWADKPDWLAYFSIPLPSEITKNKNLQQLTSQA